MKELIGAAALIAAMIGLMRLKRILMRMSFAPSAEIR